MTARSHFTQQGEGEEGEGEAPSPRRAIDDRQEEDHSRRPLGVHVGLQGVAGGPLMTTARIWHAALVSVPLPESRRASR